LSLPGGAAFVSSRAEAGRRRERIHFSREAPKALTEVTDFQRAPVSFQASWLRDYSSRLAASRDANDPFSAYQRLRASKRGAAPRCSDRRRQRLTQKVREVYTMPSGAGPASIVRTTLRDRRSIIATLPCALRERKA